MKIVNFAIIANLIWLLPACSPMSATNSSSSESPKANTSESNAVLIGVIDFEGLKSPKDLPKNNVITPDYNASWLIAQAFSVFPDAYKLVTNFVRQGTQAMRLAIDSRIETYKLDKPRADLTIGGDASRNLYPGEDFWVGFSIYYPKSHVFAKSRYEYQFGVSLHEMQKEFKVCGAGGGPVSLNETFYEEKNPETGFIENVGYFRIDTRVSYTLEECQNHVAIR